MPKVIYDYCIDDSGITSIEYAFIAILIAVAAIVGISTLGSSVNEKYNNMAEVVESPQGAIDKGK